MEGFLENLFLLVLNMSITASYVIVFVIIVRLLLKKAPKIFSYSLWAIVLFRLVCPVSFSSTLSFLRFSQGGSGRMEYIPADLGMMEQPQVTLGSGLLDQAINGSLPGAVPTASANPMQIYLFLFAVIWIIGILSLFLYSIIAYRMLHRKVSTAIRLQDHIYESEKIPSPFVVGIVRPKIYLPLGLSPSEKIYILEHEQTHIRRFDYLVKPLAFLVLCFHWFNPLVWIAFLLMSRDMEMSCDERVLKTMGPEIKKDYSNSLLSFAAGKAVIGGSPLAFGEPTAKSRIHNVLNYKRPSAWLIMLTAMLLISIAFGLISNPSARSEFSHHEMTSDGEQYRYYAPTAKQAMEAYKKALLESDYLTIRSMTPSAKHDPNGQQIWDTIVIKDVKVVKEDVREHKACYELELQIAEPGNSAFEKGVFPRWLWLVEGKDGWYSEGLMTGGSPEEDWWNDVPAGGSGVGEFQFDSLIYLSPLSSSTPDYFADKIMKGSTCTISSEKFIPPQGDYVVLQPVYKKEAMDEEMIKEFENSILSPNMTDLSLSDYKEKYRYSIYTKDSDKVHYYLYAMDDQIWLASFADNTANHTDIIMYIIRLK